MQQPMEALQLANRIRLWRVQQRHAVKRREQRLGRILTHEWLAGARVFVVLQWMPGVAGVKAYRMLHMLGASDQLKVGQLTGRQRQLLRELEEKNGRRNRREAA